MRNLASFAAFFVFVYRFVVTTHDATIVSALDIVLVFITFLFFLSILSTNREMPLKIRLMQDKWLSLLSGIFLFSVFGVLFLFLLDLFSFADASEYWQMAMLVFVFLFSLKIIFSVLGTWALDHLPIWSVLPVTFAVVIIIGSILLYLPASTIDPEKTSISFVDAFFTSTSATCVTGLIVTDTAANFSTIGQIIILMLIQVGGLGLMSFVAFFAIFLGHETGIKQNNSLSILMGNEFVSDLKKVFASIVGWTLSIESIGAFVLYIIWRGEAVTWSAGQTAWQSVFHSISAFCNAGFSLNPMLSESSTKFISNPTNLEGCAYLPGIPITIGILIVLGGIGFLTLTVLGINMISRLRTGKRKKFSLQVKLILFITLALIIISFALFLSLEWDNSLKDMTIGQKLGNAFLQAVTPRTAGFNTVPTANLLPSIQWMFIILMFIGASPGSTGGGVKTSTIGLLLVGFFSVIQGKSSIELWKKSIPDYDFRRASSVLLFCIAVFGISAGLLMLTEQNDMTSTTDRTESMDYIFESMSAFGTVGLSKGVTPTLTVWGKIVIISTMFLGRIGPATLAAASGMFLQARYKYPETHITIG